MSEMNPYAAPLQSDPYAAPQEVQSGPLPWEPSELLNEAYARFKEDWPVLLGAFLSAWALSFLSGILSAAGQGILRVLVGDSAGLTAVFALASFVVQISLSMVAQLGLQSVALASVRGESPTLGLFLARMGRLLPYAGTFILFGLAIVGGLVLLIIPGIMLSVGLCLSLYYAGDQDLGVVDALKASWAGTDGVKMKIAGFFLLSMLLNLAGLLACGVGLLVTVPVTNLAIALLYVRVSGRTASIAPQG